MTTLQTLVAKMATLIHVSADYYVYRKVKTAERISRERAEKEILYLRNRGIWSNFSNRERLKHTTALHRR